MAPVVVAALVVVPATIVVPALVDLGLAFIVASIVVATFVVLFALIVIFAFVHLGAALVVPLFVLATLVVFATFVVTLALVGSVFTFAFGESLLCSEKAAGDDGRHGEEEGSFDPATSFRFHKSLVFNGVFGP